MEAVSFYEMNSRYRNDHIYTKVQKDDMKKYILVCQGHSTKAVSLRPLQYKRREEVAYILPDIFTIFGIRIIIHINKGREFSTKKKRRGSLIKSKSRYDWQSDSQCALVSRPILWFMTRFSSSQDIYSFVVAWRPL